MDSDELTVEWMMLECGHVIDLWPHESRLEHGKEFTTCPKCDPSAPKRRVIRKGQAVADAEVWP